MHVRRGVIIAYYKGFCCRPTIFGSLDVSFPGGEGASESDKESIDIEGEREWEQGGKGGEEWENKRLPSIIHYYSVVVGTYILYDIRVRIPGKTSEEDVSFANVDIFCTVQYYILYVAKVLLAQGLYCSTAAVVQRSSKNTSFRRRINIPNNML